MKKRTTPALLPNIIIQNNHSNRLEVLNDQVDLFLQVVLSSLAIKSLKISNPLMCKGRNFHLC